MAAVTLDLWHTLIYLSPEDEEAYMAHQLALGREVLAAARPLPGAPQLTEDELGRAFERAYAAAVAASANGESVPPGVQIARAGQETQRSVDPSDYLASLKAEVERTPFRVAPGALELLGELRADGYRVGVISNTVGEPGAFLRPILSRIGFDRYVESYVFSDEQPWTKPSPEIFRFALGQLGEAPERSVHVGDAWADLEGARRAGYRGAVLFTGLAAYGARYRDLFLAGVPDRLPSSFRASELAEVAPIVERLLPLEGVAR
jgi:HAD superfamily hydrolase (TIGR01549 family)